MDKRIFFLLGAMLIFLLSGALGQAAVELTGGLTNGKIMLETDYANLKKDNTNSTLSLSQLSLTFTNKGNASESVSLELKEVVSGYTLSLSESSFTLNASNVSGNAKTITLSTVVPINKNSGNYSIGKLKMGSTEYAIETIVKPMLKIDEIKCYADGKKEDDISSDGETIKDIPPGKEIELKFKIKNLFDKDYQKGDIEDIELQVRFKDSDDEDDFDGDIDEEEELDLDAGETDDTISIKFDVPGEAKDKDYDLVVYLEGKDENGASHKVEWKVELEIQREKDDVQIETATLESSTLKCTRNTNLRATITNFGSNNQKKAAISIYNSELGLNENVQDIYLDKDPEDEENSYIKIVPISLNKEVKAGIYIIEIRAYVDNDKQKHLKEAKLTVEDCPEFTATAENKTQTMTEVLVSGGQTNQTTAPTAAVSETGEIIETMETSFTQVKGVVIFMGVIGGLLLILIVLVVYVLMRKKE